MVSRNIENWISVDYEALPGTQLALLDAAAKAFTTYGFAAASIDLIASEIGATKGSVYYHYRSKGDLFFAVHKRAMVMNLRTQVPIVQEPSLDPLRKLQRMAYHHALLMMESFFYQRVTVQGVELHQSASTTPQERAALAEVIAMRDAYEDLFRTVLQDGAAQGLVEDCDFSLAARGILGALNWITVWYKPEREEAREARHRIAEQLSRQVLFGLAK